MAKPVGAVAITDAQIAEVLSRMPSGLTLKQSCQKSKFDYPNIVRRIHASNELKQLHANCREEYVRNRVQQMHEIAEDKRIEPARARLMIDVIKWEAARVIPKEFGDRVQQDVIITDNTTLSQRMAAARSRARVPVKQPEFKPNDVT